MTALPISKHFRDPETGTVWRCTEHGDLEPGEVECPACDREKRRTA